MLLIYASNSCNHSLTSGPHYPLMGLNKAVEWAKARGRSEEASPSIRRQEESLTAMEQDVIYLFFSPLFLPNRASRFLKAFVHCFVMNSEKREQPSSLSELNFFRMVMVGKISAGHYLNTRTLMYPLQREK